MKFLCIRNRVAVVLVVVKLIETFELMGVYWRNTV